MDTPALGWEFFLDQSLGDPPTAPGEVARGCRCCKAQRLQTSGRARATGVPPQHEPWGTAVRIGSVLASLAMDTTNDIVDTKTTVTGTQLILQEVCAGCAGITKAWKQAGAQANEAIELYTDPELRTGP